MKKIIIAAALTFTASTAFAGTTDIDVAMYDESVAWSTPQATDIHVAMYDEAYPSNTLSIENVNIMPATAAGLPAFDPYNDDNCDG